MPAGFLPGIKPDLGKGRDIFGQPNEQADQEESEEQWHLVLPAPDFVMDMTSQEDQRCECEQRVANVPYIMVAEEVHINRRGQYHGAPERRIPRPPKFKQPGASRKIRSNGGIHKAGEKRDATDPQHILFRIDP